MWYPKTVTSLRKHNLRADFRVYIGEELQPPNSTEIQSKIKSIVSAAIIKGLDIIGVVSRFGIEVGRLAEAQVKQNNVDLKVMPGQDYVSADKYKAVFYNIQQNIPTGKTIEQAITEAKRQGAKVLLYDLSKKQSKIISDWKGTVLEPDFVEIYNAHSQAYHDADIDYPRVISSAARSASELEKTRVYTEISRKNLVRFDLIHEDEGVNYVPGYLGE